MHINNNVAKIGIENILNQIGEIYTKIGDEVILYPLKIVSGIVDFTENGEFNINYNIDNFTSNLGVITSNEPIVCYGEGAYKSYVPEIEGVEQVHFQVKEMSAEKGRKVKTWIMQYATELLTGEQIINDKTYTTISLNRNIRSFSTDGNPTDNEMRNYLYLYLDKKAKSPQFLMMTSKEPRYLPGGKLAGCEMSFINLNQAYSQSGKDVLNFVKMVHPGGNYPFPKEILTENGVEVVLDENRLNSRGVNDIQLQFYNSYGLNSITIYGAPKNNYLITAPRRLLLCNPHPAISSALDVDGSALNNYYAVFEAQTLYQSFWDTGKTKCEANYDYTKNKTFMGGGKIKSQNGDNVVNTNPIASDTRTFNMWNNGTFHPTADTTFATTETAFTGSSITFAAATAYKPEDFLNHNSFIFGAMEALPMEFTDTTRYTLGDFGAIGRILQGFVQIFTLGFNPGWTTNNTGVPNKSVNFLIPTSTFDFGRMMTSSGQGANDPIPFDCVNPEFSAGGNKTCVCGYRFQLTRYFQSPSQTIADAEYEGYGKNGIGDTKYLGQTKWEDGTWIFANHEPVKGISDCKAISPIEKDEEYEVFLASYKGIGLTTCRMTFYNYINHDPANVESVWESRQLTNAKFKNDLTLWTNTYKLNFSEAANNEGVIEYPTSVIPPAPQAQSIRVNEFEGVYNKDKEQNKQMPLFRLWEEYATPSPETPLARSLNKCLEGSEKYSGNNKVSYPYYYALETRFKTKNTFDLTTKIGVGKLNDYQSFSFKFKALHGTQYDFVKDVTINISDLADNQGTPIKIASLAEIIDVANADSLPNKTTRATALYGGDRYLSNTSFVTETGNIVGQETYGQTIGPFPSAVYAGFKLDKTTQILEFGIDNPDEVDLHTTLMSCIPSITGRTISPGQTFQQSIGELQATPNNKNGNIKFNSLTIGGSYNDRHYHNLEIPVTGDDFTAQNKKVLTLKDERGDKHLTTELGLECDGTKVDFIVKANITGGSTNDFKFTGYMLVNGNDYPITTIRNYWFNGMSGDTSQLRTLWYESDNFFPGYQILDFFINPNT